MASVTITSVHEPANPLAVAHTGEREVEGDQLIKTDTNNDNDIINTLLNNFLYPQELKHNVFVPRFQQRITIVKAWDILSLSTSPPNGTNGANGTNSAPHRPKDLHILDIGCGQGESAATMAALLQPHMHGARLHITGIDTARPDYGTPYTVAETHAHLTASALGRHISFRREDAAAFFSPSRLSSPSPPGSWPSAANVDAVTLCHSLWYFPTPQSVADLFTTLAGARVPRVYLAEYSFRGSLPGGQQDAHILAARAQALLHASVLEKLSADSSQQNHQGREPGPRAPNVRAALDVGSIVEAAAAAGWAVRRQGTFVPAADMIEGHLEARLVVKDAFAEAVRAEGLSPEREHEVLGLVPGVKEAFARLAEAGVAKGRAMDVWWAELER
uniref:Methyltransferase phomM' n=1 Tax=Diaporthe leptostromiformis TaxID=291059 RepID=PHOM2_DIALO|nr:RecName: Full=Methyltransferase phomM'; AltName: Full=Phomopsin biosynthesis cluster protein M' [Diaporthe leptostromiformis]AMR44285.1 methytransferase [Diaporthe leptostromiformis]